MPTSISRSKIQICLRRFKSCFLRLRPDLPRPPLPTKGMRRNRHVSVFLWLKITRSIRRSLAAYWKDKGTRLLSPRTGGAAVEAFEQSAFDVILMDMQMPYVDGCQATKEIRRRESGGRRIPIIALTANVMPSDRERCLAAGMDGFISKPIDVAARTEAISAACANSPIPALW